MRSLIPYAPGKPSVADKTQIGWVGQAPRHCGLARQIAECRRRRVELIRLLPL
jgi:hypothetical protein